MSLSETERKIVVQLQLQKAHHYSRLQGLREKSDYNCSYNASEADIAPKIEPTRQLIEKIENYIEEKTR